MLLHRFPDFQPLQLHHRADVELALSRTSAYLPPSDFHPTSLLVWGGSAAGIAKLEHGIVVRLPAYIHGRSDVLTWLAPHTSHDELDALTKFAVTEGLSLELLPEATAAGLPAKTVVLLDTPGHSDYIYETTETATLVGNEWRKKRRDLERFIGGAGRSARTGLMDLANPKHRNECRQLFVEWMSHKGGKAANANEWQAFERFSQIAYSLNLTTIGVWLNGALSAFSIGESFGPSGATFHFEKAMPGVAGLTTHLRTTLCRELAKNGADWINGQQDLGVPGLKHSKRSWQPTTMLQKFSLPNH